MVRGYIHELIEGSLSYMHPTEVALFSLMSDLGVIGTKITVATDIASGARGIAFDAPEESASEFHSTFVQSPVLMSNLIITWIDPIPAIAYPPPQAPPPAPPLEPVQDVLPEPIATSEPVTIPQIDWSATWRKFAPYIVIGGGIFVWLHLRRRD